MNAVNSGACRAFLSAALPRTQRPRRAPSDEHNGRGGQNHQARARNENSAVCGRISPGDHSVKQAIGRSRASPSPIGWERVARPGEGLVFRAAQTFPECPSLLSLSPSDGERVAEGRVRASHFPRNCRNTACTSASRSNLRLPFCWSMDRPTQWNNCCRWMLPAGLVSFPVFMASIRATRPPGHRLCEKQRYRCARIRPAASRLRSARPPAPGQWRTLFHRAGLRALLPDVAQRRHARRPPLPERRRPEIPVHAAGRQSAHGLLPKRNLRESRHELRLGHRHLCSAHAARRRGGNALTRQLRTRRRVGHASVD